MVKFNQISVSNLLKLCDRSNKPFPKDTFNKKSHFSTKKYYEDYDLFISDSNVKTICWRKLPASFSMNILFHVMP